MYGYICLQKHIFTVRDHVMLQEQVVFKGDPTTATDLQTDDSEFTALVRKLLLITLNNGSVITLLVGRRMGIKQRSILLGTVFISPGATTAARRQALPGFAAETDDRMVTSRCTERVWTRPGGFQSDGVSVDAGAGCAPRLPGLYVRVAVI